MFNESSMFGRDFKYVMALTVLAWIAYTMPTFQSTVMANAESNAALASAAVNATNALIKAQCPKGNTCYPTVIMPSLKVMVAGKLRNEYKIGQSLQVKLKLVRSDGKPATQEDHFSVDAASYHAATDMKTSDSSNISTKVSYLGNGNWMLSRPVPLAAGKYYLRIMAGCYYEGNCAPGYTSQSSSVETRLPYTVRGEIATVSSAEAIISLNPSSPIQSTVSAPEISPNQYLGLPVLVFDVKAVNSSILLKNVDVQFNVSSGSGSLTTAHLYMSDTKIATAPVINGTASFTLTGQNGVLVNTIQPFKVKVDLDNIGIEGISVAAKVDATGVYAQDASGLDATASGSANGSVIKVFNGVSMFALVNNMLSQLGYPVLSNNVTVAQPVSFSYTLTAGSDKTLYISADPSVALATTSTGYDQSANSYATLSSVVTAPGEIAGDNPGVYFIVPAGSSRNFRWNGVVKNYPSSGVLQRTFSITAINFGTDSAVLNSNSIGQGLDGLKVAPII